MMDNSNRDKVGDDLIKIKSAIKHLSLRIVRSRKKGARLRGEDFEVLNLDGEVHLACRLSKLKRLVADLTGIQIP